MKPMGRGCVGVAVWDEGFSEDRHLEITDPDHFRRSFHNITRKFTAFVDAHEFQVEAFYHDQARPTWANLSVENSPEFRIFRSSIKFLVLHAPSMGRNIAEPYDEGHRLWSLEETKMALRFAARLRADAFNFHPGKCKEWFGDDAGRVREHFHRMRDAFFRSFDELSRFFVTELLHDETFEHYLRSEEGEFHICLENVEPPNFLTATGSEFAALYWDCNEILNRYLPRNLQQRFGLRMTCDVPHLWHSQLINRHKPYLGSVFRGYDEYDLPFVLPPHHTSDAMFNRYVSSHRDVVLYYHLSGCESGSHVTHGQIDPILTDILDTPSSFSIRHYPVNQLNIQEVLDVIGPFSTVILEVFDLDDRKTEHERHVLRSYRAVDDYMRFLYINALMDHAS